MGTPSALQHYHPPTTTTQRVLLATGVAQGFGRRTWREAQAVQPTQPGGKHRMARPAPARLTTCYCAQLM